MNQTHVDQTKVAVQERCETNGVHLTNKHKQVLEVLLAANQVLLAYQLTKICNDRFDGKITDTSVYLILKLFKRATHCLST
jgi:Fe2+ or Zn2+ uptake regulation protein